MSVYKRPGASTYSYDFQLRGHRFSGSTGCATKREAQAWEKAEKDRVKARTIDHTKPMSFGDASSMWWTEVAQHYKNALETISILARLQAGVGMNTALTSITSRTIARLIAERRKDRVSNKTVNLHIIEPMRAILRRAEYVWEEPVARIDWRALTLPIPKERIRELSEEEQIAYFEHLRPDYREVILFAIISGCRLNEIVTLKWRDIDWRKKSFRVFGKGDKYRTIPLTSTLEGLIKPLPRAANTVFTYERKTARHGARGSRAPITLRGLQTVHRKTRQAANLEDFRFHDFRHTAATRLMRSTGNLKLVQKLLGHTDIATTARYAHVTDDDLREAMEELPRNLPRAKSKRG